MRRGPGPNIQDSTGYSALHHAALNGHTGCVRLLLSHEALPNLPDLRGSSPLHLAAWGGHQDIVKLLLTQSSRPADPNLKTVDNESPLHFAAQHGHTGALTTLLAHGANPKLANSRGEKPLDLAAQYGRLQVVQMLIRAHPELLLPYCQPTGDELPHSPLHLASRNGHKKVVEVLLAAGVDVNLLTKTGTALHEAALYGKDAVVKVLLDFGANINVKDREGRTALDLLNQYLPHVTKGIVSVINSEFGLRTRAGHPHSSSPSLSLALDYQNSAAFGCEQEDLLKVSRHHSTDDSHSGRRRPRISYASFGNEYGVAESPPSSVSSYDPASPRQRSSTNESAGGSFYVTMVPLKGEARVSVRPLRFLDHLWPTNSVSCPFSQRLRRSLREGTSRSRRPHRSR